MTRSPENATLDEDLGATSLDRVEVVMSLEDEFKIDISDDEAWQPSNRGRRACLHHGKCRQAEGAAAGSPALISATTGVPATTARLAEDHAIEEIPTLTPLW